jgi:hypothetical protein
MKQHAYLIEHGRPLAQPIRVALYPFAKMKVGDSFYEPDSRRVRALRSAASYWQKKTGKQFTVRLDHTVGGARCFRIA